VGHDSTTHMHLTEGRRALLVALVGTLALTAVLAVVLGLAYRREALWHTEMASFRTQLADAERTAGELRQRLADEEGLRQALERRTESQDATLADLRHERRRVDQSHAVAERDVDTLLRTGEDKSEELTRRHNRIIELQDAVERLISDKQTLGEQAHDREARIRREYEAAIGTERTRREELERQLGALEDIRTLRQRLRRLVEEMEQRVSSK
jgi:septal ring factor EnvC (AmiA/AmiB activator)